MFSLDPKTLEDDRFGAENAGSFAGELADWQRSPNPAVGAILRLARLAARFGELRETLAALLHRYEQHGFPALGEALRDLREASDDLPDLLPVLGELADAPSALFEAVRTLPLSPDGLEAAIARRSLDGFFREERWLARCDGRVVSRHMQEAARLRVKGWTRTRRSSAWRCGGGSAKT